MKVYKRITLLLLVIMMMISSTGFQKDKTKEDKIQELIDARVTAKIENFRRIRITKCRERILKRASELADSIILATAINTIIIDSITRPTPPIRPARPPIKAPKDTTPVAPFFSVDTLR